MIWWFIIFCFSIKELRSTYGGSCSSTNECKYYNLVCSSSVCTCPSSSYFWNGTYCGKTKNNKKNFHLIFQFIKIKLSLKRRLKLLLLQPKYALLSQSKSTRNKNESTRVDYETEREILNLRVNHRLIFLTFMFSL